jgi:hypothetical protein
MEDLPLTGLGKTERKLIAIFVRHGREGRAITMESLAANAGMPGHSRELTTALRSLAARGLIIRAGADPIPGAPVAFRLSRPISVRQDTKPKSRHELWVEIATAGRPVQNPRNDRKRTML